MSEEGIKKVLLAAGIGFMLVFFLFPFVWMVVLSFSESSYFLGGAPFAATLKNYRDILRFENLHFPDFLRNSLIVSALSSILSVIIGSLAAYSVSRFRFGGKNILVLGVLGFSMFPQISIVGYLFKFMSGVGWINTYRALVLPYIAYSLPLALWIQMSYFSQIPREIDEASLVDGASRLQTFTRVIVPMTLPGVLSAFLLLFMFAFNEFLFALMLTANYQARTVPVGIALFQGLHGEIPWGYIMAASMVSSIPIVMIALFAQRYIIRGLTGGAIK